jgi:hypothetical protein
MALVPLELIGVGACAARILDFLLTRYDLGQIARAARRERSKDPLGEASVARRRGPECGPNRPACKALRGAWSAVGVSRVAAQHRSEHFDGRGGSRNQFVALGTVERDSDRHPLGEPHPVEGRIDVGKEG